MAHYLGPGKTSDIEGSSVTVFRSTFFVDFAFTRSDDVPANRRLSLLATVVCTGVLAAMSLPASAQTSPSSAPADNAISADWGELVKDAVAQPATDTVLTQKSAAPVPPAEDFLNHFYFETRTEYTHYNYYFSGQPTATGVIDTQPDTSFNPTGQPYPPSFQPSANDMYSYASFGTRGLGSDRINTNFAIRYESDLTNLQPGSPSQSLINSFGGSHLFEIMAGNVEINGKPTDGWFANSSVRIGRQSMSDGPFLAEYDGASYTRRGSDYTLTLFAGRRYTYYSDPGPRALGGLDLSVRLTPTINIGYQTLLYTYANNSFTYQQRLNDNWMVNGYFRMVGRHPVDLSASTFWAPTGGKTTLTVAFFAKLTDNDYVYDYSLPAVDNSSYNTLPRLYLGLLQPYTQLSVDASRAITSKFRLAGGVTVRQLLDSLSQGPFDTSFQDYRVSTEFFPWRHISTLVQYHERDADRLNPLSITDFGDPTASGETKVQDLSVEVGHSFVEDRLNLQGGAFFRRIDFQNVYNVINNAQDKGWLGSASYRVDQHTRLHFDYSLDTDFFVWRPSIKNGQVFRLGLDWKY